MRNLHQVQRVQNLRRPRPPSPFRILTLNIILLHPIPQSFPWHPVLIRRRIDAVTFLHGYQSISKVLGWVLLVRFLLEDIGLYVDNRVWSSADYSWSGVDVEWDSVVGHFDEMSCHNLRWGPHTCGKAGKRNCPLISRFLGFGGLFWLWRFCGRFWCLLVGHFLFLASYRCGMVVFWCRRVKSKEKMLGFWFAKFWNLSVF